MFDDRDVPVAHFDPGQPMAIVKCFRRPGSEYHDQVSQGWILREGAQQHVYMACPAQFDQEVEVVSAAC